jgi:hypothetical protein
MRPDAGNHDAPARIGGSGDRPERAAAAIFKRGAPELPAVQPILPAAEDALEVSAPVEGGTQSARLALIEYRDINGNRSTRRITIQSVFPKNGDFAITAFCHERQAQRTFIASRIATIADPFTGEIHDDPIGFIKQFVLFERGEVRDETADVVQRSLPMIVVLVALARCDGVFAREEINLIGDRVRELSQGRSYDFGQVIGLIRALFPTETDVAAALRSLSAARDTEVLMDAMRKRGRARRCANHSRIARILHRRMFSCRNPRSAHLPVLRFSPAHTGVTEITRSG